MSKERLKELLELHEKAVVAYEDCDFLEMRGYLETLFLEGFTDYLIKQAERVQELEQSFTAMRDNYKPLEGECNKLEKQNQRYREAIGEAKEIASNNYLSSPSCSDIEVILSKALEESK